jgi:hypothetical protein
VGDRIRYRTLSPERGPFNLGLTNNPIYERCLNKDEAASHIPYDCEALTQVVHLVRSVGLLEG